MRAFILATVAAAVGMLALILFEFTPPSAASSEPVVKISAGMGHGSGFHIGNGYIVTAAHVVGKEEKISIKTSSDKTQDAEVLWVNAAYDIALLRIKKPEEIGVAVLSCRIPAVGEAIIAKGNPANMEFITVWGNVAGVARSVGNWRSVVVTNIVTVPGQSGGPVMDTSGKVVGVTVGVMASSVGLFGVSLVGIGYVVPASSVCDLLARSAR